MLIWSEIYRSVNYIFPLQFFLFLVLYDVKRLHQDHNRKVKIAIWDTGGIEIFYSSSEMYCRDAHAAIVVYDITHRNSFDQARFWLKRLQYCGSPNIIKALVGSKADFVSQREVKYKVICVLSSRFESGIRSAVLLQNRILTVNISCGNSSFYNISRHSVSCPPDPPDLVSTSLFLVIPFIDGIRISSIKGLPLQSASVHANRQLSFPLFSSSSSPKLALYPAGYSSEFWLALL